MPIIISASLLAADFSRLGEEVGRAEASGADWLHFDVMDGTFVPNISFGEPVLAGIKDILTIPTDVHLMIREPVRYIGHYAALGAKIITIHYEAAADPTDTLKQIRSLGCLAGISIKPATPVEVIQPLLPFVDLILIMTVEPGFGGQTIITETFDKIKRARQLADDFGKKIYIQVDGGINEKTARCAVQSGADVLVSGSFLFGAKDMAANIAKLKQA